MPKNIHPASRTLMAYLDGELPVDERYEVQAHLNACPSCREEVDTMEADLDWFLVLDAASRSAEPCAPSGLSNLLGATREWIAANGGTTAAESAQGIEQRLRGALEDFFGPSLPSVFDGRTGCEHVPDEKAESLLATFLGRRAANVLMTDIRRGNIERMWAPDVN